MSESRRQLDITPEEIESGKGIAAIAYIFFFVPLLMDDMKKNKFVMFHTEQSIVLTIVHGSGWLLGVFGNVFCIGYVFYLIVIFAWVLIIFGIINALNGEVKELPLIGEFGEKLNLIK